jgi:citrate synthase
MRVRQPSRPGPDGPRSEYMTAAEAARLLKVKPQTLYTYVSRGAIRSLAQLDRRSRLYYREDVEKMRARSEARHGASAEAAMRWGQPVVSTAITEITPDGPRYRGHAAVELARAGLTFENVAELLWTGVLHSEPMRWQHEPLPEGIDRTLDALALRRPALPMLRVYALATTILGAAEGANSEIRRGTTVPAARQLVLALAGCLGYLAARPGFRFPEAGSHLAAVAARVLAPDAAEAATAALNAALVLCADHELSSSTFAARVAASTGAELRACVLAALGAHSGALLGGGCDRAEDLLRGAKTTGELRQRIAAEEAAGTRVPGFNLIVYPRGDPRARFLLELARALAPRSEHARLIVDFIEEAEHRLHLRPSIEMGLVALAAALELPERSAGALWALGRTAGWIAHVMEQRLAGYVLRPRAKYAGTA